MGDLPVVTAILIFFGGLVALMATSSLDSIMKRPMLSYISSVVMHPIVEEVMWRLPLLVLFSSLTSTAWFVVVISGVFFGAAHLIPLFGLNEVDENEKDFIRLAFVFLSILAGFFGIAVGVIIVLTHNLLLVISLHALWNVLEGYISPHIERWLRKIHNQQEEVHEKTLS